MMHVLERVFLARDSCSFILQEAARAVKWSLSSWCQNLAIKHIILATDDPYLGN